MKFGKNQLIIIFTTFLTGLIFAYVHASDESTISNFHAANKLLKEGKYSDALKKYDAVIQHASARELRQGAIYWKGQIYFRQGKFEQAQKNFQSLIGEYPNSSIVPIAQEMMQRTQQAMKQKPASELIFTRIRVPKDIWSTSLVIPGISPDGKKMVYIAAPAGHPWWPFRLSVLPTTALDADVPGAPEVLLAEPDKLKAMYKRPAWSPDGKWIAFYRWELGPTNRGVNTTKNMGIYLIPTEGGEMQLLAPVNKGRGVGTLLSWSPDSRQLAFVSSKNGHSDIYIVSLETKQVRPFTSDGKDNEFPSWSSDGKKIAFSSRRGIWFGDSSRTWVKPVDGGKAVLMGKYARYPLIWSPDGKMIVCRGSVPRPKKTGFVAIPVDEQGKASGTPILLKEEKLYRWQRLLRWTSDGKIIFIRTDSQSALYIAEIAGGEPVLVADDTQFVFDRFSWTPDGRSLFLSNSTDSRPGFLDIASGDFVELPIDELEAFVIDAVLSPDGKMVAFEALGRENLTPLEGSWLPKGGVQIYTASVSGGKPTQLTTGEFYNFYINWSPDSKNIAFMRAEVSKGNKFQSKICVVSAYGGEVKELTKAEFNMEPAWSPDGKMIAYAHLRPGKKGIFNPEEMKGDIYVVPATGGEPKQITNTPEREERIHWSPDGKMIAFDTDVKAWVVPATGGKPRLVSKTSTGGSGPSRWSADGKYLLCNLGDSFLKAPVDGGKPVRLPISVLSKSIYSPVWSPDGKKVAFEAGRSEIQYWMMENFLE